MKQLQIIKFDRNLYLLPHEEPGGGDHDFPTGGGGGVGGGDGTNTTGGGTAGGQSGTTSGVIIPTLSISPNTAQSIAVGTTVCFNASGSIYLPQEAEQNAYLDVGANASLGTGTWTKTTGANNQPDAETRNSVLIYRLQPFHIEGMNGLFSTPGGSMNNTDANIGVKSTGGYYFYWSVMKYCNATGGNCESNWLGYARMIYPNGVGLTIGGGKVEPNQKFRVKSDGTSIIWEYTTQGRWAYNYTRTAIPPDSGDFQFMVNALYLQNKWTNLKTYRGSYQASIRPEDFIWNTNCTEALTVTGASACYTPSVPSSCQVCVSTINVAPVCVNIVSSPLFLKPVGIECSDCGDAGDCGSIPSPGLPVLTISSTSADSINVIWDDVVSFTNGLFYEVDINGEIQSVLDSSINLTNLDAGDYIISVRSVDDCGSSEWTDPETISIPSGTSFDPPANFTVIVEDNTDPDNIIYSASWDETAGAIAYQIYAGDPQDTLILTTAEDSALLENIAVGTKLSVRAVDLFGQLSAFSNFDTV